jgi:putative transposase
MAARNRKSPRLPSDEYLGPLAAHVVIVTRQRLPLFREDELAATCLKALENSTETYQAILHAYCLMPDHVHMLIEIPESVSLEAVVHHFKTTSGYSLKQMTRLPAWQTSYYDHILRSEEALENVAEYIWGNPVTAGLVENAWDYPWLGPRAPNLQA